MNINNYNIEKSVKKVRMSEQHLNSLYDNDKKPDAWKILDLLWDKAKAKNVDFLDSLFRLRVHYSK